MNHGPNSYIAARIPAALKRRLVRATTILSIGEAQLLRQALDAFVPKFETPEALIAAVIRRNKGGAS